MAADAIHPWREHATYMVARTRLKATFYSSPKFRRWLRHLPPREELIARMAPRHDIPEPGASREWEARIAQLQADMIETADDWMELLPAVERARREIVRGKP